MKNKEFRSEYDRMCTSDNMIEKIYFVIDYYIATRYILPPKDLKNFLENGDSEAE